jgi:RHS repeat-associated protein
MPSRLLLALTLGALLSTAVLAQNRPVTQYQYDANGNLTGTTSALGQATTQSYDALNRLRSITQPVPAAGQPRPVTSLAPDGQDQLTQVTDPRNLATRYSVDGLGRLAQQQSPDSGTTTYTHDAAGNILTRTDARGKTTTYSYDQLNRPTLIKYADGTQTQLSYDQGTHGIGRLTTLTDPGAITTAWTYDAHGRVLSRQQNIGATITHTVRYSYNPGSGQLASITYPSGRILSLVYGTSSRQIETLRIDGQLAASAIAWHPFGELKRMTLGNGQVWTSSLDQDGRIASYSLGGETYSLTWDAANRLTAITHPSNAFWSRGYGYDGLDRIASFNSTPRGQSFAYDASGNLTGRGERLNTNPATQTAYTIDGASNRLLGIASLGIGYQLDAAGNRTTDNRSTYSYDAVNRLTRVVNSSGALSSRYDYGYNGLHQRVRKSGPGITSGVLHYLYDEQGRLLGEYDNLGRARSEHIWLNERPVAVLSYSYSGSATTPTAMSTAYVEADHLGSPRLIANAQRQPRWRWHSAPYGDTLADENPAGRGRFQYHLRFAGQYFDAETNLHYNWHRVYETTSGRYLQSDPIGLEGGINTYAYVYGNPLSYTDPTGEIGIVGAVVGVGFEVALQAYKNYRDGCDVFDVGNYDWWDVGVSAAVGALGPGWLSVGKTSWQSGNAIKTLSGQLGSARTANRVAKIEHRIAEHQNRIADAFITQGAFQGAKALGKTADGDGRCMCRR